MSVESVENPEKSAEQRKAQLLCYISQADLNVLLAENKCKFNHTNAWLVSGADPYDFQTRDVLPFLNYLFKQAIVLGLRDVFEALIDANKRTNFLDKNNTEFIRMAIALHTSYIPILLDNGFKHADEDEKDCGKYLEQIVKKNRSKQMFALQQYTSKYCKKYMFEEECAHLRSLSEYNDNHISDWLNSKTSMSPEELLNDLYCHAKKNNDVATHVYLEILMQEPHRYSGDLTEKAKLIRLNRVKGWFSEEFFTQLSGFSDFNKTAISLWLNVSGQGLESSHFSINHLLDFLLYAAEYYHDDKTIEFLKNKAPYTHPEVHKECFFSPFDFNAIRKALVEEHPDTLKSLREARLKEMQAIGVSEEDLKHLAEVNKNYIGQRFTDWLNSEGDDAKQSARELFFTQLNSMIDVPPVYPGQVELFNFIMSKKLYPADVEAQRKLIFSAVFFGLCKTKEGVHDFVTPMLDANFFLGGVNFLGQSILHVAYDKNLSPEKFKLLIEHGADVDQQDSTGRTAADWARLDNNVRIARVFDPTYVEIDDSKAEDVTQEPKKSKLGEVINELMLDTTCDEINQRWVAHGGSIGAKADFLTDLPSLIEALENDKEIVEPKLVVEDLSDEIKASLQNLVAYTAKLYHEREKLSSKKTANKAQLTVKINAAGDFLREILSQDALTEDALTDAYNKFEQQDVNRGTGFFRVHSLANKMWYNNEKDKKKLVKSTLGELGYKIMQAVKNAPQPEKDIHDSASDLGSRASERSFIS